MLVLLTLTASEVSVPDPSRAGVAHDTVPSGTYADAAVRRLLSRARAVRGERDTTLRSVELTWRERVYVGVSGERFRRERALLHQQRAARVRWGLDRERTVRWLGRRSRSAVGEARVDFAGDFGFVDPASDRLFVGDGWAVHPLADTAVRHYRYRTGDTLGIEAAGRRVTLVEVLVEPREARFDLVAGSFWFDEDAGVLVRAAYRPARDFDLEEDEPEAAGDVPGIFRPVRLAVDHVIVDYGLQELTWWLPSRMTFEGRLRLADAAAFPFRAEWTFRDQVVNAPGDLDPAGDLPDGWKRTVRTRSSDSLRTVTLEGRDTLSVESEARGEPAPEAGERPTGGDGRDVWERFVVVTPPEDSLRASPALPERFGRGDRAFDPDEISRIRARIEEADVPAAGLPGPRVRWGGLRLARYNRVEALSAGIGARVPVTSRTSLEATARLGIADLTPNGVLRLVRRGFAGELSLGLYRRLQPAGDWGAPLGTGNSLNTLLLGHDDGLYYRAAGVEVTGSRSSGPVRLEGAVFAERHREARKETDVSVPGLFGHDLRPNIRAERGDVAGFRGELRFQNTADPAEPVLSARLWAEAAAGDFDYGRAAASLAVAPPSAADWAGAVEAGAGTSGGRPPIHRRWFLGGSYSLRGFPAGAIRGEAFWMARAEVGRRIGSLDGGRTGEGGGPLRAAIFLDAGWAGATHRFGEGGPSVGAGAGLGVLDGLFRLDVARGLTAGGTWRLHLYSDGLM